MTVSLVQFHPYPWTKSASNKVSDTDYSMRPSHSTHVNSDTRIDVPIDD